MEDSYSKSAFSSLGKAMIKDESKDEDKVNALSDNKVDVEIEPNTQGNRVNVQLCSFSLIFNCFAREKTHSKP
jgi:hypothetical protein